MYNAPKGLCIVVVNFSSGHCDVIVIWLHHQDILLQELVVYTGIYYIRRNMGTPHQEYFGTNMAMGVWFGNACATTMLCFFLISGQKMVEKRKKSMSDAAAAISQPKRRSSSTMKTHTLTTTDLSDLSAVALPPPSVGGSSSSVSLSHRRASELTGLLTRQLASNHSYASQGLTHSSASLTSSQSVAAVLGGSSGTSSAVEAALGRLVSQSSTQQAQLLGLTGTLRASSATVTSASGVLSVAGLGHGVTSTVPAVSNVRYTQLSQSASASALSGLMRSASAGQLQGQVMMMHTNENRVLPAVGSPSSVTHGVQQSPIKAALAGIPLHVATATQATGVTMQQTTNQNCSQFHQLFNNTLAKSQAATTVAGAHSPLRVGSLTPVMSVTSQGQGQQVQVSRGSSDNNAVPVAVGSASRTITMAQLTATRAVTIPRSTSVTSSDASPVNMQSFPAAGQQGAQQSVTKSMPPRDKEMMPTTLSRDVLPATQAVRKLSGVVQVAQTVAAPIDQQSVESTQQWKQITVTQPATSSRPPAQFTEAIAAVPKARLVSADIPQQASLSTVVKITAVNRTLTQAQPDVISVGSTSSKVPSVLQTQQPHVSISSVSGPQGYPQQTTAGSSSVSSTMNFNISNTKAEQKQDMVIRAPQKQEIVVRAPQSIINSEPLGQVQSVVETPKPVVSSRPFVTVRPPEATVPASASAAANVAKSTGATVAVTAASVTLSPAASAKSTGATSSRATRQSTAAVTSYSTPAKAVLPSAQPGTRSRKVKTPRQYDL